MKVSRRVLLAVAAARGRAAVVAAGDGCATAEAQASRQPSRRCSRRSQPGSTVTPLITVGDTLANGYRYESIPDGISFRTKNKNRLDLYVNHETSLVPFPYTPAAPTEANSQNDFDNSQVSHLELNRDTAGILAGELAITSAENYQRFCSNFLATRRTGFDRPLLFTNEEGIDWVKREEGVPGHDRRGRRRGRSASSSRYDPKNGKTRPIWGMGRLNHENSVAVPGYGHPVLLSGDDAFVNVPAQSQVYSYIAEDSKAVWNDKGDLWAFVSDTPGDQRLRRHRPRLEPAVSRATSSRCRRTSPPGATRTAPI